MNLKACSFERLASISLGFGRGALVGKTSLLEVEFILRRKRRRWPYSYFSPGTLQALGSDQNPRSLEEDEAFFTMRRKYSETTHLLGSIPRRFDSTVKRVPKLRFEPVSFLFLVC